MKTSAERHLVGMKNRQLENKFALPCVPNPLGNPLLHVSVFGTHRYAARTNGNAIFASHVGLSRISHSFTQYMSFRTGSPCVSKPVTFQGAFTIGFPMWSPTSHLFRESLWFLRTKGGRRLICSRAIAKSVRSSHKAPVSLIIACPQILLPLRLFSLSRTYPRPGRSVHPHRSCLPAEMRMCVPRSGLPTKGGQRGYYDGGAEGHLIRSTFISTHLPLIVCQEGSDQ